MCWEGLTRLHVSRRTGVAQWLRVRPCYAMLVLLVCSLYTESTTLRLPGTTAALASPPSPATSSRQGTGYPCRILHRAQPSYISRSLSLPPLPQLAWCGRPESSDQLSFRSPSLTTHRSVRKSITIIISLENPLQAVSFRLAFGASRNRSRKMSEPPGSRERDGIPGSA